MPHKKETSGEEALNFLSEYKDLCIKHKLRIGFNIEEKFCLIEINKKDHYWFVEQLNEIISEYSDVKFKIK